MKNFLLVFALFCLTAFLSGCGSSSPKKVPPTLPSAGSLPSTCTAATIGASYNCTITASGGTSPFKWTVSGLPAGLTSNASAVTGNSVTISGTPQATTASASKRVASRLAPARSAVSPADSNPASIQVTVADATGATASLTFSIAVSAPPALTITTTSLAAGTAYTAYSASVTATGGVTPYTWTVTGLPSGLTLSSATPSATISGTTDTAGTFSVKVTVTDSESPTVSTSATLSLTIAQPATLAITTTSLAAGTAGTAYSATISATGGITPYTWTVIGLPSGLTWNPGTSSGTITGTTDNVGTSSVKVTVTDSESPTASTSATLSLTIAQATAIAITTTSLPNGTENIGYSQTLSGSGGVKPYGWTVASGALPTGLSLSSAGVISGTPTASGSFSFSVQLTDSESPAQTTSVGLGITINNPATGLNITTTSPLPGATLNSAYTTTVTATGGTPPYTWSLASGSVMPKGLSLTSASPSATISGTPTATGTFQFTVDVKDSASSPASASASFLVTVTGSSTFTCTSSASITMCGTYGFGLSGFNSTHGGTAVMGTFVADNSGHVVSGEEFINDSVNGTAKRTITGGSYAMDGSGDGRAVFMLIDSTAASATYRFVVFSTANDQPSPVEQFDSSGTLSQGVVAGPVTIAQIPAGSVLGFNLSGVNGAGQLVGLLGNFEIGSNGCDGSAGSLSSQTGETFVVNSGGTVTTGLTATGSCTAADANGMGTAQITLSGGSPFASSTLNLAYDALSLGGVSAALIGTSDSIGANQPLLSTLAMTNSMSGQINSSAFVSECGGANNACLLTYGGTTDGTATTGKPTAAIVQMVAASTSGSGGTLTGVIDQNSGGTITSQGTWPYTAYTIDSNGVGTFTGPSQKTIHFIYTDEGLYTLDESSQVQVGQFRQQNAISIGYPGSNYIFGGHSGGRNDASVQFTGVLTFSGGTSGTISGISDVATASGVSSGTTASGSYSSISATTGRGTGTAKLTNGSTVNVVIYAFRNRKLFILDAQSTSPYLTSASLQ